MSRKLKALIGSAACVSVVADHETELRNSGCPLDRMTKLKVTEHKTTQTQWEKCWQMENNNETNHNSLTIQTKIKKKCFYVGNKQININDG